MGYEKASLQYFEKIFRNFDILFFRRATMATLPVRQSKNPLSIFRTMMDDFLNEPFFTGDLGFSERFYPRIDITEDKERYLVRADLPGLDKNDITVSIEGDSLIISGERKSERKVEEGAYSHMERTYGSFQRSLTLPQNVNKDKIDASYKNGVLELSILKTGETKAKGKQIEIKS
jgi:HSP20 family protein